MLHIEENISLRPKTTMRIGGFARWYADIASTEECEEAAAFAEQHHCPLIVLGGGSNTIFADGIIAALVVSIAADSVTVSGNRITVEAGKNLPNLVNELAAKHLDLSPLTGIPGTVGGAVYGNAGQGFGGIWIDTYIEEVTAFVDGHWQTFQRAELAFAYRTSAFKAMRSPLIWSVTLKVPSREATEVKEEIARLLKRRIETQPHVKTAGSCFLSVSKELPAWKLIDAAGMRGANVGAVEISEKHANFLINKGKATFEETKQLVEKVREAVGAPLHVEMRFVEKDGTLTF